MDRKEIFETVLQLISTGKIKVKDLISEIVPLKNFDKIYSNLGSSKSIASIIKYDKRNTPKHLEFK